MKRLILLILILGACSATAGAQDVPTAVSELRQAKAELEASKAVGDIFYTELKRLDGTIAADAAFKQQQADENAALRKQIDRDRVARVTLICWGMGAVNGLAWAGVITCIAMGLYPLAIRCAIVAAAGTSIVLAIVYHSQQLAVYGFGAIVVISAGGALYVIWHARQFKDAAKTQAQILPLAAKMGVISNDAKLAMKKIRAQISGPLAKRITSEVTGKSPQVIDAEAAVPVSTAASV